MAAEKKNVSKCSKQLSLTLGVPEIVIQDATPIEGDIENLMMSKSDYNDDSAGESDEGESSEDDTPGGGGDRRVEISQVPADAAEEIKNSEAAVRTDDRSRNEDAVGSAVHNTGAVTSATDGATAHREKTGRESAAENGKTFPESGVQNATDIPANFISAKAEWDAVETAIPGGGDDATVAISSSSSLSLKETISFFKDVDLTEYSAQIKPSVQRTMLAKLKQFFLGPPKLAADLHAERNFVFSLGLCPFDNEQPVHCRMLQTVYRQLTGNKLDCPRYGSHWEQIGFQGNDPATDLRGMGMLGLLTALSLLTDSKTLPLARDIHKLSLHETQNFPFFVMSINMTRIVLQALREDCLNRECNRRRQVLSVVNTFYAATFLQLYTTWKQHHKTIKDSGFVIKDLEQYVKRNPKRVLHNLEHYLTEPRKSAKQPASNAEPGQDTFSNVCEVK